MDETDNAKVVRKLLDNVNYEIIKILEKDQKPFLVGQLTFKLRQIGIEMKKPTLIYKLREFETFGWINRPMHAYHEHTEWEPYSSRFYQKWLAHRESIKMILDDLRQDIEIARILPEAERLEMDLTIVAVDKEKMNRWKNRMRQAVAKLLEHFDKLDSNSKKYTFHLAYKSEYFETLPYG